MPRYGSIKQRKLLILFRMGNLPVGGGFLSRELPGQKLLFQPHVIHHFSLAGDKIFGAFQHHTDLFRCSNEDGSFCGSLQSAWPISARCRERAEGRHTQPC